MSLKMRLTLEIGTYYWSAEDDLPDEYHGELDTVLETLGADLPLEALTSVKQLLSSALLVQIALTGGADIVCTLDKEVLQRMLKEMDPNTMPEA